MQKIALYGLGTETERVIEDLNDKYDIVGLLDGFRDSGEMYGKKIIALNQVTSLSVSKIIVVARPGSCKAIAKRIGDFCRENNIALFDIRGKDLLIENRVSYDFIGVKGYKRNELIERSKLADVVSFDLFDTLIMRRVFSYTDIFEIMGTKLSDKGIAIPEFSTVRLQAEKELSRNGSPFLFDIYYYIVNNPDGNLFDDLKKSLDGVIKENEDVYNRGGNDLTLKKIAEYLVNMEYEIDRNTICLRRGMVEVFNELVKAGKDVYITTDTYYSKKQIIDILDGLDIVGYKDVLVSCEYNKGKRHGLFEVLKSRGQEYSDISKNTDKIEIEDNNYIAEEAVTKKTVTDILHIGDDPVSDIEAADCVGIESFKIYSAEELFDVAGGFCLEHDMVSLSDRIKVGMLNASLFNSPFQFETSDRRITLSGADEIGYTICAPVICDYMFWFREKVRGQGIKNVWFSARDGYLPRKLYEMMGEDNSIYFLTSRIAAIRAGMKSVEDILYVDSMKYFGTVEENLKVRFGIESEDISAQAVKNKDILQAAKAEGMLEYTEAILERSKIQRQNYMNYIARLNMCEGSIAFFDFVAKGTTQMYVQSLTSHLLKGFYFLQLEPEFMKDKGLDIEPFYSTKETGDSAIFDNYYILETLLTAPDPQVMEFDENGEPVYAVELRCEKDLKCFEEMQQGVLEYFDDYLKLITEGIHTENKVLDEKMLALIHSFKIADESFLSLTVEDPFFNRMTNVMDLI
ncbi:MAG: hypothetical protein IJ661_04485 [Lachnospiraceae bacterium]|nr:hypothetical protein [Lachnospiraceae bacterium]